jgi:thymidylate synthase ThyX
MEIWDEVVQEFNEEIQKLRTTLASGAAEDYSHYRQLVGSIQGLEWARGNLTEIIKKRTYAEDEE